MELLMRNRFYSCLKASPNLTAASGIMWNSCDHVKNEYMSKRNYFFGGEPSSGSYTKGPKPSDVFKKLLLEPKTSFQKLYQLWKDDFILWGKEWKDKFNKSYMEENGKGIIDMLFTFEDDASIKKFSVITDKSNKGGYSTATFVRTQNETGLFSGFIDTRVPDDGVIRQAGYASILTRRLLKSFHRFDTYNLLDYTHFVLKLRGDGRTYCMILGCPGYLDATYNDQFHYPLYTRGGPYWQITKIPISNFYFTSKGRIQDQQQVMPYHACSKIGITLADGNTGPFKLEIEYIGLEFQPYHKSICPYEHYAGKSIAHL